MKYSIKKLNRRADKRGFLIDFLSLDELEKQDKTFGQIYYVTFTTSSAVRGNHYHRRKREWFMAVNGRLQVVLKDIKSGERVEFIMNGNKNSYQRIEVKENIAHAFRNISKTALMLNYCNKPYHFGDPDTIPYKLLEPV